MNTHYFPAYACGLKDIGWLKSRFYFSFSDYYNPMASAFGTLVAFNDDTVAPGEGFGIHPHSNMEIISILLQGRMNHKDTLGYSTEVGAGSVQIMSAGTGLRHEEYNIGKEDVQFLQIWIQPKLQNITPRYQQRHFPRERRKGRLQTIVSSEEGQEHCWINQNAKLSLGYFGRGAIAEYRFARTNKCIFIFLIEGRVTISGHTLDARDALGVWNTDIVSIHCDDASEFLIIETPVNQK